MAMIRASQSAVCWFFHPKEDPEKCEENYWLHSKYKYSSVTWQVRQIIFVIFSTLTQIMTNLYFPVVMWYCFQVRMMF